MKCIADLYYDNVTRKWYDYPVRPEAFHYDGMAHQGKTIHIYHQDGNCSIGFMFGEKQYTFDPDELIRHRADYQAKRKALHERNQLLARIATYDDETLSLIV